MSAHIKRFATPALAAEACGAEIFRLLDAARAARGSATLAVSGGSTPRIMFEWMAKQTFDWKAIDLFWVDERCVPADDAQSNYRMTRESLLDHALLAPTQIHRVKTELIPDEAAEAYIDDIARGTVEALRPLGYEVINLGSDRPVPVSHVIVLLEEQLGRAARIDRRPAHPADAVATWADIGKARRLLGWTPETPLADGLRAAVAWYRQNRDWASRIDLGS